MCPSLDCWVVAYAIAPAIEKVNTCFVLSQNWSLLIAQQEAHIANLVTELCVMFCIEAFNENFDDVGGG